ncbi:MAG: phosphodiester glycosidase family protein [Bacteroidales bacterium]|nr:phosphodiester glycosidase family protein [Bacteroidales bacterium]
MNKTLSLPITLFLLQLLITLPLQAQRHYQEDSIAFVNAEWQTDTLDGFLYRHYHFQQRQIFNSNQYLCVIEIPRGSKTRLRFVADSTLTTVSNFAQRTGALAGINGSYFNMSTGVPVCYLRIGGKEIGTNEPARTDSINRKYYQNAAIRLLPTGRPRFNIPDSNRLSEKQMPDSNVMTAGPMLISKGVNVPQRLDRRFVYARHNRTAIGLKPDGTIILLVADGRSKEFANGLSLPELTRVMRWLGCCDAANLDGGGSSTMYINNRSTNGIVNHPSDNGRFDPAGQRPVANAILLVTDTIGKPQARKSKGN